MNRVSMIVFVVLILAAGSLFAQGEQIRDGNTTPGGNPGETQPGVADTDDQPQGNYTFLIMMVLFFVVMYFLMIRPQKKRQKEHQNMLENIKAKDVIVTTGGIVGRVMSINKERNTLIVQVDASSNVKIEVQRNAVAGLVNEEKS